MVELDQCVREIESSCRSTKFSSPLHKMHTTGSMAELRKLS